MMNGCDHQPVQKNLSEAIRVANELFPDVIFVHSSFDEYVQAVEGALPEHLSTVTGELTSQETDGWYTLANTSSSRIYLKQAFQENSNLLEQVVEPLTIITGGPNHKDQLTYAWKALLQNAPMIVSVVVAWTKFTVRWRHVLPRLTKSEPLLRPIFSTSGRAKLQLTKLKVTISLRLLTQACMIRSILSAQ